VYYLKHNDWQAIYAITGQNIYRKTQTGAKVFPLATGMVDDYDPTKPKFAHCCFTNYYLQGAISRGDVDVSLEMFDIPREWIDG